MKKITALFIALILLLTACGAEPPKEATEVSTEEASETEISEVVTEKTDETVIRIQALKGPTSMGLVKLLEDNEKGESKNAYDFEMAASSDTLVPKLTQGEIDIACIPANLASVLYNKTEGGIKVVAVNTLGVTYIVSTEEDVLSFADLKGKTVLATGKQAVPEMTLRSLLEAESIDPDADVTFEWKTDPTEIAGILATEGGTAMLPQPFVTVAQTKAGNLQSVVNLSQEWETTFSSPMVTGVTVVSKDFAENHKDLLDEFLAEYSASIDYVNENPDEASIWIEKYDIVKAPIAKKSIPECNLRFMDGEEMKSAVSNFLTLLYEKDPKSVGGKLPDETFYYTK